MLCACGGKTRSADADGNETLIDIKTSYQTVEGFGASAAWWSQSVGNWENADEILKLLYSKSEGIGLNIYRYNLGAGSNDTNDLSLYEENCRTNCFLQSDGSYDWDNDAGAMNALKLANEYNDNLKVTLFANSPPVYMTYNGRAYLSPKAASNLSENSYQAYADYIVTCAEHFIDEGYNVTSVSPINEPEWGWDGWDDENGSYCCNQEGCHYPVNDALNFYNNYMIPALKASPSLNSNVGLEVWESGQINPAGAWNDYVQRLFSSRNYDEKILGFINKGTGLAKYNKNIRKNVDAIAAHSYWASTEDRTNAANLLNEKFFGQKVRCTEYCQMTNDANSGVLGHIQKDGPTNGMEIDYGLALADIIYQDLTILNAVEWDWWLGCSRGIYTDGLLYINDENHSDIQFSKRYWCLGNYSKFIESGAKRVKVETAGGFAADLQTNEENIYEWDDGNGNTGYDKYNYIDTSAFLNPDGSLVVVYVNNSDTAENTSFNVKGYGSFETYVTDAECNLELCQTGGISDSVDIPARAVTTVVLR